MSESQKNTACRYDARNDDKAIIGCAMALFLIIALMVSPYFIAWTQHRQIKRLSNRIEQLEKKNSEANAVAPAIEAEEAEKEDTAAQ